MVVGGCVWVVVTVGGCVWVVVSVVVVVGSSGVDRVTVVVVFLVVVLLESSPPPVMSSTRRCHARDDDGDAGERPGPRVRLARGRRSAVPTRLRIAGLSAVLLCGRLPRILGVDIAGQATWACGRSPHGHGHACACRTLGAESEGA